MQTTHLDRLGNFHQKKKLHLGCGTRIKSGWVNIDISPGDGVTAHDLTKPLLYVDGEVGEVYAEHFIEHITLKEGIRLMKECNRVLTAGGVIRLSTPDLDEMIRCYQGNLLNRWQAVGWVPRSACMLMNEGFRSWGHQFQYNEEELTEVLRAGGFRDIMRVEHDSIYESRPYCGDLIIRATK